MSSQPQTDRFFYDGDYRSVRTKRKGDPEFITNDGSMFNNDNFAYFNPKSAELGKREIISKTALYDPQKFKKYWKNKKDHKDDYIELYEVNDMDGDDLVDYIAYDKARSRVVGYNDKVVKTKGYSERPYKRAWANIPIAERRKLNQTYREWLGTQEQLEGWGSIEPKAPTKFQSKVLMKVFEDWLTHSSLAKYIKYAILGRINTTILNQIVDLSKYSKDIDEQKLITKEFKQTSVYREHMKTVYESLEGLFAENKLTLLRLAYGSLEGKNTERRKNELNEHIKNALETAQLIYTDVDGATEAVEEWRQTKAINKFIKDQGLSKKRADLLKRQLQPKDDATIKGYNEGFKNEILEKIKNPLRKRKRDLSNAWKLKPGMEEEFSDSDDMLLE